MTLSEIQRLLAAHQLRPLKQFGQNFLFDENLCRFIVQSLPPHPENRVLEIGPGLGAVTGFLLDAQWHVEAIEIDRGLSAILQQRLGANPHFQLRQGDALELLPQLPPFSRVIGNLPYNITTPLLVEILQQCAPDLAGVFLIQREVALRLTAKPRTKEYGALSIYLQSVAHIEHLKNLSGHVFHPAPDVASSIIRLTLKPDALPAAEAAAFYQVVRKGFSQRRKKLKHLLPIPSEARAEELSVEEWKELYASIRGMV